MGSQGFRPMIAFERSLLQRLIETLRSGDDGLYRRLLTQLDRCLVRPLGQGSSCLEFNLVPGLVPHFAVAEGVANDADAVPISVVLFVTDGGLLFELEVLKADDSPIIQMPSPERFQTWLVPRFHRPTPESRQPGGDVP